MLRTKHLLLGSIALLAGVVSSVYGLAQTVAPDLHGIPPASLSATPHPTMGVVVDSDDTKSRTRESLIARLRGSGDIHNTASVGQALEESGEISVEEVPVVIPEPAVDEGKQAGLTLGDGRRSSSPKTGSIFACEQGAVQPGSDLPWVRDGRWFPEEKPVAPGSVFWTPSYTTSLAEGARIITANSLPAHSTGVFPLVSISEVYRYRSGEGATMPHVRTYQFTKDPVLATSQCVPDGLVGVAINGVPLYRSMSTTGLDLQARSILDRCGGQSSPTGEYHYYSESECLFDAHYEGAESTILGYALDGFGIFANSEGGEALTNDDLDECHGHAHDIPWDGASVSMYHYHMTDEFPYTIGCFRGTPSFP